MEAMGAGSSKNVLNPASGSPARVAASLKAENSNTPLAKVLNKVASEPLAERNTGEALANAPSKGLWGLVDGALNSLEKLSSSVQDKHSETIKNMVNFGNKGSLAANAASMGEAAIPVLGEAGNAATNTNLVVTGVQGFLAGLKSKDAVYAFFKLADAVMFTVPRELQFGMRLGPSGYNLALATRQQNNIKEYSSFSEGIKKNLEQVSDYIKGLAKFGFINGYKAENADESKAFAVGGPLKGLIGSTGMILSYIPLIPKPIANALKSAGYLSRFAGAVSIDFSEAMSKNAQSQFSGAAKMDFLAGAASDLSNKIAERTKNTLINNFKMDENALPVKIAEKAQLFFKNLTPTLESLGRVVSAKGVEVGITNEKYKTVGFKGILSKWVESHLDALINIPAKGTEALKANQKDADKLAELKAEKVSALKISAETKAKVASRTAENNYSGYADYVGAAALGARKAEAVSGTVSEAGVQKTESIIDRSSLIQNDLTVIQSQVLPEIKQKSTDHDSQEVKEIKHDISVSSQSTMEAETNSG